MFYRVTLTGADDSVKPHDLVALSLEFPFVEWGILIGSSCGTRFPSEAWIKKLITAKQLSRHTVNLSLHICGKWLREIAAGRSTLLETHPHFILRARQQAIPMFERCQLNWHGQDQGNISGHILAAFLQLAPWNPEIIFQFDGVNDHLIHNMHPFNVAALFDQSHGAGVLPKEWDRASSSFACGYAGGLGPDNVVSEQEKIHAKTRPEWLYWIDMETKLFTDGEFDLSKCRSVLAQMSDRIECMC